MMKQLGKLLLPFVLMAASISCSGREKGDDSAARRAAVDRLFDAAKKEEAFAPGGGGEPKVGLWHIPPAHVDPIDGVKTQLLTLNVDPGINIVLAFDNGKLRSRKASASVWITAPCIVEGSSETWEHTRRVRMKFDDDKFIVENWGISDDRKAIFPHSSNFISNMKRHKSVALELGCDRGDTYVVKAYVEHLQDAIDGAGLRD
jgi:hypothetical protein